MVPVRGSSLEHKEVNPTVRKFSLLDWCLMTGVYLLKIGRRDNCIVIYFLFFFANVSILRNVVLSQNIYTVFLAGVKIRV